MKKDFLAFYVSRAILSSIFSLIVMGFTWKAVLFATILFGGFLIYLHSGWFRVDLSHPFMPLRRDPRGLEIQRKALIMSVISALLIYLFSSPLSAFLGIPLSGNIALSIGIMTYFVIQFIFFARA
jgi:hypothetical protein